jgi:hypothetical protein
VSVSVPSTDEPVVLQPTGNLRVPTPPGRSWKVRVAAQAGLVVPIGVWQNPARGEWVDLRGGVLSFRLPAGPHLVQGIDASGVTHQQAVVVPAGGEASADLGGS